MNLICLLLPRKHDKVNKEKEFRIQKLFKVILGLDRTSDCQGLQLRRWHQEHTVGQKTVGGTVHSSLIVFTGGSGCEKDRSGCLS